MSIRQRPPSLPQLSWDNLIALLTVAASAAFTFRDLPIRSWQFWVALLSFLLFTLGLYAWSSQRLNLAQKRGILYAMMGLAGVIFFASKNTFSASILFFILSAAVTEFLPGRRGYGWILIFGLVTMLANWWRWGELWLAVSIGLATLGGYIFFGASTRARLRADQVSAESQRLLDELQLAHHQLQQQAQQAEELAASEERNRLARELHDTLGHRLTVAAVGLEAAQKLIAHNPSRAQEMVGNVRTQVLEGLGELRSAVATLRAPLTQDLPLASALTRLVNEFAEATDLAIYLVLPEEMAEPPAEHRHALYRAAQESLTNIQRHARAQHVQIQLAGLGDVDIGDGLIDTKMLLRISDDGVGMTPEALERGYGLRGIRERVSQLGGSLEIRPNPPRGTTIVVILPLPLPDALEDKISAGTTPHPTAENHEAENHEVEDHEDAPNDPL